MDFVIVCRYAKQGSVGYQVIRESDLTLSPAAINPECSRTYDAIALGSLPIIEDVSMPTTCNSTKKAPYALLKQHKAPVIFVKDWSQELPDILVDFESLTLAQKSRRRLDLMRWYKIFKLDLQKHFISVITQKFELW